MANAPSYQALSLLRYARNANGTVPSGSGAQRKTTGAGYFPAPFAATASVNTGYGAWVQIYASVAAALYVVGYSGVNAGSSPSDSEVQLGVGAAGSETVISDVYFPTPGGNSYIIDAWLPFPIPVAAGVRLALRAKGSAAPSPGATLTLYLRCINQSDLVAL